MYSGGKAVKLALVLACLLAVVEAGILHSKETAVKSLLPNTDNDGPRTPYPTLSTADTYPTPPYINVTDETTDVTDETTVVTDETTDVTTDGPFSSTTPPPEISGGVVVRGDCAFDVNGDLNDPAPIFTPQNQLEWLVPSPSGVVELSNGAYIDMYCDKSFIATFSNRTKVTAQCLQKQYFLVDGVIHPFSDFSCTSWPAYTARRTGRPCNGGTDLVEIGFVLASGFLQIMDVCHDEVNEVTRYVHHKLNPSSAGYQHGVTRPSFITGDFYAGKNVDNLYTKVQQNNTISKILGMDASPFFNDTIDVYLARGHMAAKVDFIFGAPQKATFFFVNAAPQWQMFNGRNWERVEDSVRRYASDQALDLDCYTGIWGVSTLPDVNGVQRELYLDFDENNNGLIPVPKLYFRVVIDRKSRNGIVLIGVNNPHVTLEEIKKDYVICKDVGNRINWVSWDKENLMNGYSYACAVDDFISVVKDLPLDDLYTSGLLGVEALTIENIPS